jgi:flavin reductase (DIM6/NTAB) family NADH-FMN oxidoreductase RutF
VEESTVTADLRAITGQTPERPSIAEFVEAMSALASGVVLVTCRLGDRPWGMTVTAFASVSADPPTILVSLGSKTTSADAIKATGCFGVSILAQDQLGVARFGSAPGADKFLEPFVDPGDPRSASPVVAGALAHLDCRVADATRVGDHTIFLGHVCDAQTSCGGRPLLYHRRAYRNLAEPNRGHPSTGRNVTCLSS